MKTMTVIQLELFPMGKTVEPEVKQAPITELKPLNPPKQTIEPDNPEDMRPAYIKSGKYSS